MARLQRGEIPGNSSREKMPVGAAILENERGVALFLALGLLALLTILGAWAIGTATTDMKISGNFRNTQNAFYAADAALVYASNPDALTAAYTYTLATGTTAVWSQTISIGADTATINVNYQGSGPLPAGSRYDGDLDENGKPKYHGHYFVVNTEGITVNNTTVALEAAVVQVFEGEDGAGCGAGICIPISTAGERVLSLYWRLR